MKHIKRFSVVLAAVLVCGSLAGCQSSTVGDYATTEVAKYGSESIKLDEANFWLRLEQVENEAYYGAMYTYFGYDNMWEAASGSGDQTMGDYVHQTVMSQLWQTRVLNDHATELGIALTEDQKAKVAETVSQFLENYPVLKEVSDASEEQMQSWVEMNATANLVAQSVRDAAEVDIPDEEIQAYAIEYINVNKPEEETTEEAAETEAAETEAAETTGEETEPALEGEELANQVLQMARDGSGFEDIDEALGTSHLDADYLVTGETSTDVKYTTTAEMAAGEVQMITQDSGWIIVKKLNDLDEDATETRRETRTDEIQTEAFNNQYAEWVAAAPKFTVNDNIWSQIAITDMIYEAPTEEEVDETAEESEEESAEEVSEAAETEPAETTAAETTAAATETTAAAETTAAE